VNALGYALFALVAGCMLPLQAGVNTALAEWVGGPVRASLVSFVVGTLVLLAIALVFFRDRPTENLGGAPWWIWVGGLLGAFFVVASVVTAPRLGAATMVVLLVAGQAVAALVLDHYGWVGFPVHHVTPGRIVGVALLAGGVALVRLT
jgi:transporter family-2 protein